MNTFDLIRREALRRGLRPKTIQTYQQCVWRFFRRCTIDPFHVRKQDIEGYLDYLLGRHSSGSTLNVYLNALKFFYEQVLHRRLTINLHYSKVPKRLPEFLEPEEVSRLLDQITNQKQRLLIALLYGAGLRVSELTHVHVQDLDLHNNYGWVRDGKGGKDRLFIIPRNLKEALFLQMQRKNPEEWLFPGRNGKPYSTQSVRIILNAARKAAAVRKRVHPHALRHSFATHIIKNGYSALELQPLLGHSKLETTMQYVHMASPQLLNVQSPYDTLSQSTLPYEHPPRQVSRH